MKIRVMLLLIFFSKLANAQCDELYKDFFVELNESIINQMPEFSDSSISLYYDLFYTNRYNKEIVIRDSIRIKKKMDLSINDSFLNEFTVLNNKIKFGTSGSEIHAHKIEILVLRFSNLEIYFSSFFGCDLKKLVFEFAKNYLAGPDKQEFLDLLQNPGKCR